MVANNDNTALLTQLLAGQERLVERVGHLEVQIADALGKLVTAAEATGRTTDDHEVRLRAIEGDRITRTEYEKDVKSRQTRFYLIGGLITGIVVPVITSVVTVLLTRG